MFGQTEDPANNSECLHAELFAGNRDLIKVPILMKTIFQKSCLHAQRLQENSCLHANQHILRIYEHFFSLSRCLALVFGALLHGNFMTMPALLHMLNKMRT